MNLALCGNRTRVLVLAACGLVAARMVMASPLRAQSSPARWTLRVDLQIGSERDHYRFTHVTGMAVAPDGTIFVEQRNEQIIRVYDRKGSFLQAIGGEGLGPGEFANLAGLSLVGDMIWAGDAQSRGGTFFARNGAVLSTVIFRELSPEFRFGGAIALSEDRFLAVPAVAMSRILSGRVESLPLVLLSRSGAQLDTLDLQPIGGIITRIGQRGQAPVVLNPVPPQHHFGIAGDGKYIIVASILPWDDPEQARFLLERYDRNGIKIFSKQIAYDPIPVPERFVSRAITQRAERVQKNFASLAAAKEAVRDHLTIPEYFPYANEMIVGDNGAIWLTQGSPSNGRWIVLDAIGNRLAIVRAPDDLRIFAADGHSVWGVCTDKFDRPFVLRFTIARESQTGGENAPELCAINQ